MIIVLFICKSIWHFAVPWYVWIIAVFDSVATVTRSRDGRDED